MPAREKWIPLLLALAGLGFMGGMAHRETQSRLENLRQELERKAQARLQTGYGALESTLLRLGDSLSRDLAAADTVQLRRLSQEHPLMGTCFRLDSRQSLVWPSRRTGISSGEEELFFQRTRLLWSGRAVLPQASRPEEASTRPSPHSRWISWHWEDGLHILFLAPDGRGGENGAEIDRTALLSRLIGEMPELPESHTLYLVRSADGILHRFGQWDDAPDPLPAPLARTSLPRPFETWSLEVHGPQGLWTRELRQEGLRTVYGRWGIAAIVYLLLLTLGWREWTRAFREARLRTGFVSQVSHELRTPLTNIRLHTELARDGTLESDTAHHLEVVAQESERLSRLVSNILTFARHERGKVELHPVELDLREVLETVLATLQPTFTCYAMELERSLPQGALRVRADADACQQILHNLLGNAVKYAAAGQWVGLEVRELQRHWEIRVRDRGAGIPPRHRESVFQPFQRLSDRITDGVAGTGIGLTIARELARSQGGDLHLEPSSTGASFLWTLPKETP